MRRRVVRQHRHAPPGEDLPGGDLLEIARRGRGEGAPLLSEQGGDETEFAKSLVEWPWKLIHLREADGQWSELYDIQDDPRETRDLATERPRDRDRLASRLWEICDPQRPIALTAIEDGPAISEAEARRLEALGY